MSYVTSYKKNAVIILIRDRVKLFNRGEPKTLQFPF